ncbi:TSUP family transporter [Noviherbaspirillum sp. CPCC 100848]|uniref:Probable membrane transporter protein n=1 Tax=Noviherbaspirillum album TaxID=3080276 RepID=A0ABU6JB10_9BURK|nr:TSUP family transporter [Noviherbaspirillum sp. CPCC 100848]MEC4720621.1 TSUP family transporter [Noviherbaspirillum sp. CPCC 100848]
MEFVLSPEILAGLFAAAAIAGFVDAIAGGGGLITIPVLLLAQVPPLHALATNKLQSSFGSLTASLMVLRRRLVRWSQMRRLFVCSLIGSAFGAFAVQFVSAQTLDIVIPIVLVSIAMYFLLAPNAGAVERKPRVNEAAYQGVVVPGIGFYDGMFGPGTGSFFSLAGVALRGHTLLTATAQAKVLNFASNVASLAVFVAGGKVLWTAGAAMVAGQILGAWGGSHAMVRGGTKLIRPMIVTVCVIMLGRYLWQKGFISF